MVLYIEEPINHLSWQTVAKSASIAASDCRGDCIIGGSDRSISIWRFLDTPEGYDRLPLIEVATERIPARACKVLLIGDVAFAALTNGSVLLYQAESENENMKFLKLFSSTKNLHPNYRCSDMLFCAQTNQVITCGDDGVISSFNIECPQKSNSKSASESSLRCIDLVSPNDIICGTQNGFLLHYDLRTNECVNSFEHNCFSPIMSLQRNPDINHLATGGNSDGSIIMYDLRGKNLALAQISAHNSAVTNIKYKPGSPNTLCSSSIDGQLFKWNLDSEFTPEAVRKKLESISVLADIFSIASFDINPSGDIIYTTDHGALYYHRLDELRQ